MTSASDSQKPKRRLRQFSLRTLFVLLTLFGIVVGWKTHEFRRQRDAQKWISEQGGRFAVDSNSIFGPIVSVDLRQSEISDLTPLSQQRSIRLLVLRGTAVRDLSPLSHLDAIEMLDLSDSRVEDLTPLATATKLQRLDLRNTRVRDLTPLATSNRLRELDLSMTQVRDITPLMGLESLQRLELLGLGACDLTPLSKFKQLRSLYFSPAVRPASSYALLKQLQQSLPGCHVALVDELDPCGTQ